MKKFLFTLTISSLVVFFSCKKSGDPGSALPPLSVSTNTLTVNSYAGYIDSFTVTYEGAWSISVTPNSSWLQLSSTNGNGTTTIRVTIKDANGSGAEKAATIEVIPEGNTSQKKTIAVKQRFFNFSILHRVYGGTEIDNFYQAIAASDGGYIAVGVVNSANGDIANNKGRSDVWVVKVNTDGAKLWEKTYGGSELDEGCAIIATPDGGYLIAAATASKDGDVTGNENQKGLWVFKIDVNGNIIWKKIYGGSGHERPRHILASSDGGYLVVATTSSNDGDVSGLHLPASPQPYVSYQDVWLFKIDASGNLLWQKPYGGSSQEYVSGAIKVSDGYIIVGTSDAKQADGDVQATKGDTDIWVFKVNETGVLQWQKSFGGTGTDDGGGVVAASDGGYIITGRAGSPEMNGHHGGYDGWIIKLDGSGNKIWDKTYGGTHSDGIGQIVAAPGGGYIAAGGTASPDGDVVGHMHGADGWIIKLSSNGTLEWQKPCGGTSYDVMGSSVVFLGNNEYLMTGTAESFDQDISGQQHGKGDGWLIKFKIQ